MVVNESLSGVDEQMSRQEVPPHILWLQEADHYPHPVDHVQLIQTHISYVLLAGSYVYKIKKDVDLGFLDFTRLSQREYFCRQEIVLNQRLCPDIYLDVVAITSSGEGYAMNGGGEVVDYAVRMVRMPAQFMMQNIMEQGRLTRGHMARIVDVLVPFYRLADCEEGATFGSVAAVAANVLGNFEQTRHVVGSRELPQGRFDVIETYVQEFLRKSSRFEARIAAGKIRDCHGDLHSGNICLDEDIHIFDCIEFNPHFRLADVAADIAFLAMDLDFYDLSEYGTYFVHSYIRESGDQGLLEMLDFYKCYRAYVRGKIHILTAADDHLEDETHTRCLKQAARYFRLAEHYAHQGQLLLHG